MAIIAFIVNFLMMVGIMISSFYIFIKSIKYTANMNHKILTVAWCLLWAVLYAEPLFIPYILIKPLVCLISVIFILILTKLKFEIVISAYMLAFGISFALNYIASFLIGFISMFLLSGDYVVDTPIDFNQSIYILIYTLIFILQLILSILFFRIRRFKKGFPFIFKKYTIVVSLIFTGIILILVTWVSMLAKIENNNLNNVLARSLFIIGVVIIGVGIYILIRRLIKMFQRKKAQQNTDNYYEKLLAEKDEEIKRLIEIDNARRSILHNFTDRLISLEKFALKQGGEFLEAVQNFKKDFRKELASIKGNNPLQFQYTKVKAIDILFEHFAEEFTSDNITFNVMVDGSIKYMVDNIIEQGKLAAIIANHLKNAQIAVNASDNPSRLITAIIGLPNERYEFIVLDSGIPFEIDTLMLLGKEYATTHADTGGGGIGLMTTFKTMKEYGASLIINEKPPNDFDYTKSVTVRFDGENRYVIETYRADDIFRNDEQYMVVKV